MIKLVFGEVLEARIAQAVEIGQLAQVEDLLHGQLAVLIAAKLELVNVQIAHECFKDELSPAHVDGNVVTALHVLTFEHGRVNHGAEVITAADEHKQMHTNLMLAVLALQREVAGDLAVIVNL